AHLAQPKKLMRRKQHSFGHDNSLPCAKIPLSPVFRVPPWSLFRTGVRYDDFLAYFSRLKWPRRSSTAPTIKGSATVASSKTSAKRPPSSSGTNFPHETASVYVLPLRPPQWTGSGQMRTP